MLIVKSLRSHGWLHCVHQLCAFVLFCTILHYLSVPPCPSTQRDIEQAKKNWELGHLQSLKEEEERLAEEEFNNVMLTYDRPEAVGKVVAKYGLRRLTSPSTGRRAERQLLPGQQDGKPVGSQSSLASVRNKHPLQNHSRSEPRREPRGRTMSPPLRSSLLPKRLSNRARTSPSDSATPSPRRTRK